MLIMEIAFILSVHYVELCIGNCYVDLVVKLESLQGLLDQVDDCVILIEPDTD